MTIKEQLFCYYYSQLQNPKEAAIKSGFNKKNAEMIGAKLLLKENIKERINFILNENKKNDLLQKSIIGLERLAFGSISDAIKLTFVENKEDLVNLSELDLFNISEIKKSKTGGVEIKFFDRLKALEKILEISQLTANKSGEFDLFDAIKQSAKAVSKDKDLLGAQDENLDKHLDKNLDEESFYD
ncbi:MAG: terminase small subunit [Oscillospiraceae bacterium]|nr:terminase small subunit [Oscillospiraceae bacterium]